MSSRVSRWDREKRSHDSIDRDRRPSASRKGGLAGLIFMCNSKTKRDCFHYKVLGLPLAKRDLVEQVVPGTFLFLFDFEGRELHGIYEAVSHGGMNLEPKAFQGQGSYPAQVRFEIHRDCLPLSQDVFSEAIKENYYARNKFLPQLTSDQVSKLIQIFCPVAPPPKRLHAGDTSHVGLQAEQRRQGLPERTIPVSARMELMNRDTQYLFPAQAPGVEQRLPMSDPLPRPVVMDAIDKPRLPPIRVLEGRPDQMGLLTQGHMEEVDQLALKYLQPSTSSVNNTLDPYSRNAALSVPEAQRLVPIREQEASIQSRALEAERLRRAAVERTILREQGALHLVSGSDARVSPLAPTRPREAVVASSPSRRHDIRRRM